MKKCAPGQQTLSPKEKFVQKPAQPWAAGSWLAWPCRPRAKSSRCGFVSYYSTDVIFFQICHGYQRIQTHTAAFVFSAAFRDSVVILLLPVLSYGAKLSGRSRIRSCPPRCGSAGQPGSFLSYRDKMGHFTKKRRSQKGNASHLI